MTDSWYSPKKIIADARYILGSVDLDPASCERAQEIVQATRWIGLPQDGRVEKWRGNWWCNPPFSEPELWVPKAIYDFESYTLRGGSYSEGLMLLPVSTGTKWWRPLWNKPIAWVGRLKFWGQDVDSGSRQDISLHLFSNDNDKLMRFHEVSRRRNWHVTMPQSDCVR